MRLWTISEQLFQMLSEYLAGETDDADLLAPSQVKHMVDEMLASFRFNDEYTASVYDTEEIRRNNPIDRQILQLIYGAKRLRAQLVKNDISEVVDQMHELSAELNIPIKRGSINEKILGREMLRAIANYYEESADRERKERGLPDDPELKQLSLDQLRDRVSQTWQRQFATANAPTNPPPTSVAPETGKLTDASTIRDRARPTNEPPIPSVFSGRVARHEARSKGPDSKGLKAGHRQTRSTNQRSEISRSGN